MSARENFCDVATMSLCRWSMCRLLILSRRKFVVNMQQGENTTSKSEILELGSVSIWRNMVSIR